MGCSWILIIYGSHGEFSDVYIKYVIFLPVGWEIIRDTISPPPPECVLSDAHIRTHTHAHAFKQEFIRRSIYLGPWRNSSKLRNLRVNKYRYVDGDKQTHVWVKGCWIRLLWEDKPWMSILADFRLTFERNRDNTGY